MDIPSSKDQLAKMIDHTLLNPAATYSEIDKLCDQAKQYGFYGVCVNPIHVKRCKEDLKTTGVKIVSVIGFPFGAIKTEAKLEEAREAINDGADELDMVINLSALRSKDLGLVKLDIESLSSLTKGKDKLLKVIIETAYLTQQEKVIACQIAVDAGADFVKTSTGYGPSGATVDDVKLMKAAIGNRAQIKAAGGIHDAIQAIELIRAGATRIGSSHSIEILNSFKP